MRSWSKLNEDLLLQLLKPRDIWLAYFPYEDRPDEGKVRPVLVLDVQQETAEVLVMMITSHPPRSDDDIAIEHWAEIPLLHQSTLRTQRVQFVSVRNIRKRLGKCPQAEWVLALEKLNER